MTTPAHHLYRTDAPETSVEAAEKLEPTTLERLVFQVISSFGDDGCISDDVRFICERAHGIKSYSSVTARYKALEEKGAIFYTGEVRPGSSGRNQRVMMRVTKIQPSFWDEVQR